MVELATTLLSSLITGATGTGFGVRHSVVLLVAAGEGLELTPFAGLKKRTDTETFCIVSAVKPVSVIVLFVVVTVSVDATPFLVM
jgi:hypothetical protein